MYKEHEQEKHFIELDRKLTKLRDEQQENQEKSIKYQKEKNKSWFRKIFKS